MVIIRISHEVYDTAYHLVWVPKYRIWILRKDARETVKSMFHEILESRGCDIEEMGIAKDYVYIFVSIPTKYSIGSIVSVVKWVSTKEIFRRHPEVKRELWGGEFWEDGYFVRTVGDKVTAEVIKKYVQYHRHHKQSKSQSEYDF